MRSSLSSLVNNLTEDLQWVKCKSEHDDKKCETCGIKYKYCNWFLEYKNFKGDLIEYKCLSCNKIYQQKFNEKLKEIFLNTYKFSNYDNNKFNSLLQKGVYPYEYMDDWEKFNETSLLEKEDFYSQLNLKDTTDTDYAHGKRVCKDFEIKNLQENHDLYVQSDTLLLVADVFENFRNMCINIYALDPAKFISVPGLAWQAALKKTKITNNWYLLTDIDMLLMVEKGIRGGICNAVHQKKLFKLTKIS